MRKTGRKTYLISNCTIYEQASVKRIAIGFRDHSKHLSGIVTWTCHSTDSRPASEITVPWLHSITGNLPPSAGEAFHEIYVTAFPKDELGYDFHTFAHQTEFNAGSGRYRLSSLPAGTYGVLVTGGLQVAKSTAWTWIPDIEVRAGLSLDLPITLPEGRPVEVITADRLSPNRSIPTCTGWRLQMPSGDWLDGKILTGELSLPLGRYTIEAQYGPNGAVVSQPFTVERGEGTEKVDLNRPGQDATSGPLTR
jgi:hypothetical protein